MTDFSGGGRDSGRMSSRVRRGGASGPAEWLLVFLDAARAEARARAVAAAAAGLFEERAVVGA